MKILGRVESEAVIDVQCDVCDESTRLANGNLQYGKLEAHWGYGTTHDGERYELHLCEDCFFATLAYLKQERRMLHLVDGDPRPADSDLGFISRNDLFHDGG